MSNIYKYLLVFFVFAALAAFLHFYFPEEGDPDIFYHFKHAEIYRETSLFRSDFPWLPYTIVGKYSGDMWYGFHLLLTPFTYFENKIFGIKLSGVFITAALFLMFYSALRLLTIGKPVFWTLFIFFSIPEVLYHLTLIRPHALSTGLAALLFALLIGKPPPTPSFVRRGDEKNNPPLTRGGRGGSSSHPF